MNVENILKVAEVLESDAAEDHFAMSSVLSWAGKFEDISSKPVREILHNCGTTACILGWTVALADTETPYSGTMDDEIASKFFDMDQDELYPLFYAEDAMSIRDPKAAARVVRHLAATGKVDWSKAFEGEQDNG